MAATRAGHDGDETRTRTPTRTPPDTPTVFAARVPARVPVADLAPRPSSVQVVTTPGEAPPRRTAPHRRRGVVTFAAGAGLVAAALGVGYLLTSGGPLSVVNLDARPTVPLVVGAPGMSPGGAPQKVVFLVGGGSSAVRATLTGLTPIDDVLPLACPARAWEVTLAGPVPIASALVGTRVPATLALSGDAPASCQGLAIPTFSASVDATGTNGRPVLLHASLETPVTVATLGTPGVAVRDDSGRAVVVITPDPQFPAGTHYTVEATGPNGRWAPACLLSMPTPCRTDHDADDAGVHYRVTARLGAFWRRTSADVHP